MSKLRVKCGKCGTVFKTNNTRQIYCNACTRQLHQEKIAAQAKPASRPQPATIGAKPAWLNSAGAPAHATVTSPTPTHERRPARPSPVSQAPEPRDPGVQKHEPEQSEGHSQGQPHGTKQKKPAKPASTPPKPKREPKPASEPFVVTDEQIALIEQRYIELAQPAEFDGIRTQIARELGIPKSVVKKAIATLRARDNLPSWWDLRGFDGTPEEQEQIRRAYERYLPVPPLGVHKIIAEEIQMPPVRVYLGIRSVRQAMGLPPYNPPESHPELASAAGAR
jgi:hypothetical protein